MAALLTRVFVVVALLAPACAQTPSQNGGDGKPYLLGPNDKVTVRCLYADEFPLTPIRIDNDGKVTLPFVGRVQLGGLTIGEAEKELTDGLSKYVLRPQVAVNLVESHSQPVSVFGAFNNPGVYQLEGDKSLTEIISMAGGIRHDAGRFLKVTRRVEDGPLPLPSSALDSTGMYHVAEIDLDAFVRASTPADNIQIRPYDVISIPQADLVYVVGQVRKPGGFTMTGRNDFTVLQALSLAEGMDRTALGRKARLLRKSSDASRFEIEINLDGILAGRAPDLAMQADDVLFVPNNTVKSVGLKTLDAAVQLTTGIIIYGHY